MSKAALSGALLLLLCGAIPSLAQQQGEDGTFVRQDLSRAGWDISNQNGSVMVSDATLPVMVLEALYEAGKLSSGDPIYRSSSPCCPPNLSAMLVNIFLHTATLSFRQTQAQGRVMQCLLSAPKRYSFCQGHCFWGRVSEQFITPSRKELQITSTGISVIPCGCLRQKSAAQSKKTSSTTF